MLKIKLYPRGKKHQRTFRVVVAESRTKYNGNFVADLGFYTPQTKTVKIDEKELASWVKKGAQITLGVDKLIHPELHPRVKKVKPVTEAETAAAAETKKAPAAPVAEPKKEEPKVEPSKSEEEPTLEA